MKFKCEDEQFVELRILSYEFPEIIDDEWDSNWLIININAKSNDKHWNVSHASITTFELKSLINWFENISNNKITKNKVIEFTEPNLSFELLNDFNSETKEINIIFRLELSPIRPVYYDEAYYMKFTANNEILKKYMEELKNELKKYPER